MLMILAGNLFFGPRVNDFNVNTPANIFMEGKAVGLFYGYKTDGIVQEGDADVPTFNGVVLEPGDYKFIDARGGGDDLLNPMAMWIFWIRRLLEIPTLILHMPSQEILVIRISLYHFFFLEFMEATL